MTTRKAVTTARSVQALKPETKKYTCVVKAARMAGGGLLVQVTPAGAKTYYSRQRLNGKRIDIRLGAVNELSLPQAVDAHNEAIRMVSDGIDPRQAAKEKKAEQQIELNMGQLFDKWASQREEAGDLAEKTLKAARWRWAKYLQDPLGELRLSLVTRKQLALALDRMREHTRDETRKAISTLNGCLDYALARGLIDENPARLLRPKDFQATTAAPRDRWLSIAELRELWEYLNSDRHNISYPMVTAFKLLMFTGARRAEVIEARWSEIDLTAGVWVLPGERSKNKQSHTFYLAPYTVALLESLKPLSGDSEYVFESPNKPGSPIRADAVTKAVGRICKALECEPFTVHDLRRTCASHWVDTLGADSRLAELMLNHLPADKLVRTYQQGKQSDRQKMIWLRWADFFVQNVITDGAGNVVSLRAEVGR